MKLISFYLVVFTLIFLESMAQSPTLTALNYSPALGDTLIYTFGKVNNFDTLQGGVQQTWDYSNIVDTSNSSGYPIIDFQRCVSASTTPYAMNFPAANLALYRDTFKEYQYFTTNPNISQFWGLEQPGVYNIYSMPQTLLRFPFSYGSTFTDSTIYIDQSSAVVTSTDTVTANGYGILKLKTQVFPNVLRLRRLTTSSTPVSVSGVAYIYTIKYLDFLYATPGYHGFLLAVRYISGNYFLNGIPVNATPGILYQYYYAINATSLSPLPLKFISFDAILEGQQASLHWKTAEETNTSYFKIQRSLNGTDFENIADIKANGSTSSSTYSYFDKGIERLNGGTLFYRLQGIDKDGQYYYSQIDVIKTNLDNQLIRLYPNPTKSLLFLDNAHAGIADEVSIYDIGRHLLKKWKNYSVSKPINITSFAQGIYFIVIKVKDSFTTLKILKE